MSAELIYSAARMNRPRKIPECMGNAGRVAGEHAWTRVGVHRGKYCMGCGRTRAELLKLGRDQKTRGAE